MEEVLCFHVHLNSNTTIVKVKSNIFIKRGNKQWHSNTTIVKVKFNSAPEEKPVNNKFKYNDC